LNKVENGNYVCNDLGHSTLVQYFLNQTFNVKNALRTKTILQYIET